MFRYSRISSLGFEFEFPKSNVVPQTEEYRIDDVAPQTEEYRVDDGALKRRICFQLMETLQRVNYALKRREWDLLADVLLIFETQIEQYKVFHGQFPHNIFWKLFVMLKKAIRAKGPVDKLGHRKMNKIERDIEASTFIRNKLDKYIAQYQDFRMSHVRQDERDSDVEDDDCQDVYDHVVVGPIDPWVKGKDETAWELVEKRYWDIPRFLGEQKVEHIRELRVVAQDAVTPSQKIKFIFDIVKAQLMMNPTRSKPIPVAEWKICILNMFEALEILETNANIVPRPTFIEIGPDIYETKKTYGYKARIQVRADLLEFLMGIYYEFDLSLKFLVPGTDAYQERLKDESMLVLLFDRYFCYFYSKGDYSRAVQAALLYMELVYYRTQDDYDCVVKLVGLFFDADVRQIAVNRMLEPPTFT